MPQKISWPAAVLLSVLVMCTTALVWKGIITSHALFAIGGAIVGWLVPRSNGAASSEARAARRSFPPEEIPTKKTAAVASDDKEK